MKHRIICDYSVPRR